MDNTRSKKKHNPSRAKSELIRWLPPILWAALIFTFSSMEQVKVSQLFFWDFLLKKTAHIAEYAILYALIFRANGKKWVFSFIILLIYAISDEIHQSFVPGRTPSPLDIGFDMSGASTASYIIWKLKSRLT